MRFVHTHPGSRVARLLAAAVGAITAVGMFILPTSATASPQGYGASQLSGVSNAVDRSGVAGIAWYVDAARAEVATLRQAAGSNAGALRVQYAAGVFTPLLSAGDAIYGGQYRCSLGFNVVSGSTYYFLTAGHCGKLASTWYTNSGHTTLIGPTVNYSFPGNDYALVRYDNLSLSHPGGYAVADAFVGESVTRRGPTTGVKVSGLIQTNVCAEPGDSGGPLYDGTRALGLTSGGSGNCSTGGTTFFQPAREAANAYGVTIF